jgi:hypothetical protein
MRIKHKRRGAGRRNDVDIRQRVREGAMYTQRETTKRERTRENSKRMTYRAAYWAGRKALLDPEFIKASVPSGSGDWVVCELCN